MLAFALLAAAAGLPEIRIEAVPGKGYAATVARIDADQYTPVVDRIKVLATQRCGRLKVRFGRYFFDNQIDTDRGVTVIEDFRQNFSCYDPATDPYKPVPADWQASAAETAAVTRFATRFLDNLDDGNGAVLAAMMDPQLETTPDEMLRFSREAKMHQTGAGEFTARLDGWLNNPEDAAYPGAYAYFAVISSHPGIAGTCGGVLVYRVRDGQYQISQYDVRYISQALIDEAGYSDEELNRLCQR
ncbi:MAG: hypothetical protein DI569_06555 [Sphingopyxis macrogoltabida]|uniref:Uncharacterized protein n=1 Tax=Sphingopyxis macrogoltabida TaxID=33050 RepID=A0A2W5MSW6_SPHMC|nr:MAG: hypothetical protein DI569_06555 [Sphingopyxis macrogoltabida]